jgi:type VI secretion system protein ImpA
MALLDIDNLLQPISDEEPCGPNLEYDMDYAAMESAARGKPEQQYGDTIIPGEEPNWREVQQLAFELAQRSKDLRIGCLLARAALANHGLPGFAEALELIRGYLERYWATVHPQLDPEDDNDPTLRVNTISSLGDVATTVRALRLVPMVSSRPLGQFSLRDLHMATGEILPPLNAEAPELSTIEAAFMECDLDQLRGTAASVRQALDHAEAIERVVTEQVGAARAVNLENLRNTLREIDSVMNAHLSRRDVGVALEASFEQPVREAAAADGASAPAARLTGEIRSREDVILALDKICQYYDRYEPSSPLPLLLKRAKRLANKSFLEIVKDLTPDALAQIQALGGVDSESE